MKKILIIIAFFCLFGCDEREVLKGKPLSKNGDLKIIEIEGHKYIMIANGGIIHAESCKCKELKNVYRRNDNSK